MRRSALTGHWCKRFDHRRGNVLVLTALLLVGMFGFLAFSIDVGYLCTVHTELQRAADAAAMAAAWELLDERRLQSEDQWQVVQLEAWESAALYGALNTIGTKSPGPACRMVRNENTVISETSKIATPSQRRAPSGSSGRYSSACALTSPTLPATSSPLTYFRPTLSAPLAPFALPALSSGALRDAKGC